MMETLLQVRCLSAVCFQKTQSNRTSHVCLSELRLYVVCASACVISCCVGVCVSDYLSVCAHDTGLGPGRGVILQWSACNSRTEHRWEQKWTGSDQTETTTVILTDPLWHQQRCTKEVFYSIIFYTLSIFLSMLCLTNTNQHSWHTPSVPKKTFFSKKRPGYFVIFSSFLISDVLPDQEAGFVCGVIVTVLGFRSIVQRFLVRCSTSQSGDEFPSVVGGGGALWVGFIY